MPEKNSSPHITNCCNYCGSKFTVEFLKKLSESSESLFCENCGTEIIKNRDNNRIDDNNHTNGLLRRTYENLRNRKNPMERVLIDSDFPVRFKVNLTIVVARLGYPHIRSLEFESPRDVEGMELSQEFFKTILVFVFYIFIKSKNKRVSQ